MATERTTHSPISFSPFVLCALMVVTGCSTYQVFRGARVPRPAPLARSGQPADNLIEVGLTAQSVGDTHEPTLGDEAAGVHIPRHQGRVDMRFRIPGSNFDMGLVYERGLEAGSYALAKGSPTPDGDTQGGGLSMYSAIPISGTPWYVGIGAEFLMYQIPYVEFSVCVTNCPTPYVIEERGTSSEPVAGLTVVPSYRANPNWSIFGGLSARNHPTIERTGIEGGIDLGNEVEAGPINFTVLGGVEYSHPSGVRAMAHVYQVVSSQPVSYYPTLGISVTIPLAREHAPSPTVAPSPAFAPSSPAVAPGAL